MPDTYPVVDLTVVDAEFRLEAKPEIDPATLAAQLKDISDAVSPVLAQADGKQAFGLDSIELSLTVGAEGGVWFVAKGSAEASIKATFSRQSSSAAPSDT